MPDIQRYSSGTPWEEDYGYSRAVRAGGLIHVSGTVASDAEGKVHGDGVYAQTVYIFRKIERALEEFGASLSDIVRVRVYLTADDQFEEFGRAHAEMVGDARPSNTAVVVEGLASEEFLVEIDAVALAQPDDNDNPDSPRSGESERLGFRD